MEIFPPDLAPETDGRPTRLLTDDLIPDSRLEDSALDAFGHREIAGRVADIAINGGTPLNIALFGPWGSGKSSFFRMLSDELIAVDKSIKVIRYDAWKFGGESLKRNFVSNAASGLGLAADSPEGRPFHRGLYESVRSVDFNPGQFLKRHWKSLTMALFGAVAVCGLFVAGAAWVWSVFSNVSFGSRFSRLAPGVFKYFGTALFAVGALINVLATVNVEQTRPSEDERFAELFKQLIVKAELHQAKPMERTRLWKWVRHWGKETSEPPITRIVFFIDELDRCSKEDVVATLTSLRTFLDQEGCVFIVAADREVIEEALTAVDQSTPIRENEPYYSSASAFLDKIFQNQIALPPLRTGRLTRFAKDLVRDRAGLWADLRGVEVRDRLLNNVLYALIPAHVRSPRRVKVLLNNFATNVRVAESRGIPWIDRSTEIAKLTVLQTEFPRLASDLLLEPRLPALLLHPPSEPTERQVLLLERHRLKLNPPDSLTPTSGEADTDDPDALLVDSHTPTSGSADRRLEALRSRQREDLRRYLTSREAAGIPDPGRDLLYLEYAGDALGLEDSDLSQLLEDYAADSPDDVRSEVQNRPPQTRIAAARMLGVMAEREFGPERQNVVTTLAEALEGLPPPEFEGQLGDLIVHVTAYAAEEDITDAQLPGLIALAVGASDSGDALRERLFADERLVSDPEILERVSGLLPYLRANEIGSVSDAICAHHLQHPGTALQVLAEQPDTTVDSFLRAGSGSLVEALNRAEQIESDSGAEPEEGDPTKAGKLIIDILDALERRIAGCSEAAVELLIAFTSDSSKETYWQVRERAAVLLSKLHKPANANKVTLSALSAAPISDWTTWASFMQPSQEVVAPQNLALDTVLHQFALSPSDALEAALEVIPSIFKAGHITSPPDDTVELIKTGIGAFNYWSSDDSLTEWATTLELVRRLTEAFPDLADDLASVVATDIGRAATEPWDTTMPQRIQTAGLAAGGSGLVSAVTVLSNFGSTPDPTDDLRLATSKALMTLSGAAILAGLEVSPVPMDEVLAVAQSGGNAAHKAIAGWFDTAPSPEEVLQVVADTKIRKSAAEAATRWAQAQDGKAAAKTILQIVDSEYDQYWVGVLSANVESRIPVLDGIAKRLKAATSHEDRLRLVQAVDKIRPDGNKETRSAAKMALELLTEAPSKVKVEEAAVLIPHLTGTYGMKSKIKEAVSSANAANRVDKRRRKIFEDAGLLAPKKSWSRKLIDSATRR